MGDWTFEGLTPLTYNLIVCDPPWAFELYSEKGEKKSPQAQYACMDLDAIKALQVGHLAAGDCVLKLWGTAPMVYEQIGVLKAWGFAFKTMGFWHKKTKHGKTAFGPGYLLRSAAEPFLIGTVGNPVVSKSHRNVIEGLAREHSRKPEEAYAWAETYMPHARRAELFARQKRKGWDCWGNEVNRFSEAA